jgi:hypothetical protein
MNAVLIKLLMPVIKDNMRVDSIAATRLAGLVSKLLQWLLAEV